MHRPSLRHLLRYLPRILQIVAIILGIRWISHYPEQWDDEIESSTTSARSDPKRKPPAHDQVIVAVRVPAVEAYAQLPTQLLLTDSIYYDSIVLFSDLEMDLGGFHIHDVLARFDAEYVAANPDFHRYRRQIEAALAGQPLHTLKEEDEDKERETQLKLDKYKYLQMLERTWNGRPEREWYVFMEGDTYLVRRNLLEWLAQFNPEDLHFFGNMPSVDWHETGGHPFARGGSTFILSVAAMRHLMVEKETPFHIWEQKTPEMPLGHISLSNLLEVEVGLKMNSTYPMLSGFTPASMPFGPGTWCEPIIALHGMRPDEMSDIWRLERDRFEYHHSQEPLMFADLWMEFLKPEPLFTARDNWDNLSSDETNREWNILLGDSAISKHASKHAGHPHHHGQGGHRGRSEPDPPSGGEEPVDAAAAAESSFEACREACDRNEQCMQYSYSSVAAPNFNENGETRCHLSRRLRFGNTRPPEEIEFEEELNGGGREKKTVRRTWKSGWRKERFESWAAQQRCKSQQN